ncbi:ferritin superfamily protein [Tetragenococcus muriaticus PMC-11-5]|uniref:Ferritin superfamily protein n=2 Tax=Tetragenococcus muriaticus TaxID=64642 RepID=A0A091CDB7_9ENTE|nr:ferritin superfamily protein [Tetragenococcus muriaticus PMC-11-5]
MLDEGEVIPTTTEELTHYSMLEEKGCLKYEVGEVLLEQVVKDFDTQLLFINKGITLAETENKFGIVGFFKKIIYFYETSNFCDTKLSRSRNF